MDKHVVMAYPTPVGRFRVPDAGEVNRELRALILERERAEPSQQYANAGGWHSKADLFDWPHPAVATLRTWVFEAVQHTALAAVQAANKSMPQVSLAIKAWANISRAGNYHRQHNHPGACWSGAYFVDSGGDAPGRPLSGLLELLDPRPFTEMVATPGDPFGQKAILRPEPGTIVVFPGWLYHFVNPHFGPGERISVAFNAEVVVPKPQ